MYQLSSHNLSVIPAVTHYDSNGNITKKIEYHPQSEDFEGDIDLTLYNEDGTISDEFKIPFRSFNNNFMLMYYSWGLNSGQTIVDTGGTGRAFSVTTQPYLNAAAGTSTFGIQVGASGSSATQSIDTRVLSGLITTGTAKGQLAYSGHTFDAAMSQVSGSWKWSVSRTFTNSSAGNVNVTETGLTLTIGSGYLMNIARDVTDANGTAINVTVAPTQVLTVRYNFYFPIGSGLIQMFPAHLLSAFSQNTVLPSIYYAYGNGDDGIVTTMNGTTAVNRFNWVSSVANIGPGSAICVGTGSAPIGADNWNMGWITHGSGSSQQLRYGDVIVDGYTKTYSTSGSAVEFVVRRPFTNAGPDVTIREASLWGSVGTNNQLAAGTLNGFLGGLAIRTLTGNQTVVSGSTIEISYKLMIAA